MKCEDCGAEGARIHLLTDGELCGRCHGWHVAYVLAMGIMLTVAMVFIRGLVGGES